MDQYNQQAIDFLKSTSTSLAIKLAEKQTSPNWASATHGLKYECTLSNDKSSYTFDFWGSIHDAEPVRMLEEWSTTQETSLLFKLKDLLEKRSIKSTARISSAGFLIKESQLLKDIHASILPSSYDVDSRKAEKIYNVCIEQDRQLRRMFTHEQLEQLQDIN